MAKLTEQIDKKIEHLAKRHAGGTSDYEDAIQEGRLSVLTAEEGQTESWYVQHAEYAIRHFMTKERLYHSREVSNTIDDYNYEDD